MYQTLSHRWPSNAKGQLQDVIFYQARLTLPIPKKFLHTLAISLFGKENCHSGAGTNRGICHSHHYRHHMDFFLDMMAVVHDVPPAIHQVKEVALYIGLVLGKLVLLSRNASFNFTKVL